MDPSEARFDPPTEATLQPPQDQGLPIEGFPRPPLRSVGPTHAEITLLGVPFDGTSGRSPMQRHAPGLVRAALTSLTTQDPERAPLHIFDAGDVRINTTSVRTLDTRLQTTLQNLPGNRSGTLPVLIGGEHTISLPAVRALEPRTIISLDAHSDLWKTTNGRTFSHGTWLYHARQELNCTVALPLTRTLRGGAKEAIQHPRTYQHLPNDLPQPVYLTLDVDVFDPEHAPAVAFPEPGGPHPEEVLSMIEDIAANHQLIGMDIVEVNANRLGATSRLAAAALLSAAFARATPPRDRFGARSSR